MSTSEQYDVAIVGASIAGCTAATLYGRQGMRVALIERHADPAAYKTVCTHFVQSSGVPVVERLGLGGGGAPAGGRRTAPPAPTARRPVPPSAPDEPPPPT